MDRFWPSYPGWSSPFTELERMRREMDRLLDTYAGRAPTAGVFPPVNVSQDADNYYVRAELPGVTADTLEVTTSHHAVAIAGSRQQPREEERQSFHRRERPQGAFHRTVTLPGEFQASKIEARQINGILTITLPKAEAAKPRQIPVQGA
ncbi:MAG TPA: Hsp20/alpha crystallin family protein [Polyangia bacterium]|jgi:HSP20 family protein